MQEILNSPLLPYIVVYALFFSSLTTIVLSLILEKMFFIFEEDRTDADVFRFFIFLAFFIIYFFWLLIFNF